jgi:DNA-binding MarR family transcriptional regulator
MTSPARRPRPKTAPPDATPSGVVDLDRYLPALLAWIATKLQRGASQHYRNVFDVGIETWRCLVLLAIESSISAQRISRITGMDKSSVSRCFKSMQAKGLISMALDDADGRLRIARLTPKGRKLHDQMLGIALERDRALVEVLAPQELDTLIGLLRRLHENLPGVEKATRRYVAQRFPKAGHKAAAAADRGPSAPEI